MRKSKVKASKKPAVAKKKPVARPKRAAGSIPLAAGQIWRVAGQNLQVMLVGKLLVHYKLAVPNAVRVSNSVGGRAAVEKYLKSKKAVLHKTIKVEEVKY